MAAGRTILHVDLDAFYVGVELAKRPDLIGKPVIVGGDSRRGVVLSASYEARRFGVDSGIPTSRAARLCPVATFLPPDFDAYRKASQLFMEVLQNFAPLVEPTSLDEAYIDYTGCEPLHGPARSAADEIRRLIHDSITVSASVGIGSSRVVAKIASAAAKPDGVIEVPAGQEAAFLSPLAIRKLPGIGPKAQQRLEAMGIQTLGELASLSAEFLDRGFGSHGSELALRARGIDAGEVHAGRPVNRSISKASTFSADLTTLEEMRRALRRHAAGVAAEVRKAERTARTVTLQVRFSDFSNVTRSVTLSQPTSSEDIIAGAAVTLLDREMTREIRPVRLLGVSLSNLVAAAQLDLFGEEQERRALGSAVDQLREKFGHAAVRRVSDLEVMD